MKSHFSPSLLWQVTGASVRRSLHALMFLCEHVLPFCTCFVFVDCTYPVEGNSLYTIFHHGFELRVGRLRLFSVHLLGHDFFSPVREIFFRIFCHTIQSCYRCFCTLVVSCTAINCAGKLSLPSSPRRRIFRDCRVSPLRFSLSLPSCTTFCCRCTKIWSSHPKDTSFIFSQAACFSLKRSL